MGGQTVIVVAFIMVVALAALFSLDMRPKAAVEHMASTEELEKEYTSSSEIVPSATPVQVPAPADETPTGYTFSKSQEARLRTLGFSDQQLDKFQSMSAEQIVQVIEQLTKKAQEATAQEKKAKVEVARARMVAERAKQEAQQAAKAAAAVEAPAPALPPSVTTKPSTSTTSTSPVTAAPLLGKMQVQRISTAGSSPSMSKMLDQANQIASAAKTQLEEEQQQQQEQVVEKEQEEEVETAVEADTAKEVDTPEEVETAVETQEEAPAEVNGEEPPEAQSSESATSESQPAGIVAGSSAEGEPTPTEAGGSEPKSIEAVGGSEAPPLPKWKDLKILRTLPAPEYCYTAVNGEKAEPCNTKMKAAPSDKTALRIGELMAEDRPCWIYTRECALSNMTDTRGKPFHTKYAKPGATLEEILPNLPNFTKGGLGTCAVVGTADNLVGKGWGKQIDAHDFVVRFNTVTKGYEKDVGFKRDGLWTKDGYHTRETSSIAPTRYHMIPKFPPKNLVPVKGLPVMVYGNVLARWREVAREVYAIYKKEKKIVKGTPTGGLARIISMIESELCSRVDVYGFSSGGGKYFKRSSVVKDAHVINIEHYLRRVIMATQVRGQVCVYGV